VVLPDERQAAALYCSSVLQQPGPIALPGEPAASEAAAGQAEAPVFGGYEEVVYHDVLGHVRGTWGGSVPQQPDAAAFLGSDTQVRPNDPPALGHPGPPGPWGAGPPGPLPLQRRAGADGRYPWPAAQAMGVRCDVEAWWSSDRGRRGLWYAAEHNARQRYHGFMAAARDLPDPGVQHGLEAQYERFCSPLAMLAA
jgi:hypothetical protein